MASSGNFHAVFGPEFDATSREDYSDPQGLYPDLEFWNRKCSLCKERLWQYSVKYLSEAGLDLLFEMGVAEDYFLLCDECFEEFEGSLASYSPKGFVIGY